MNTRRYKAGAIGPLRKFALFIRTLGFRVKFVYYTRIHKMDLDPSCKFSLSANLDTTNPKGIHVGAETYIAFGSVVLAHDMSRRFHTDTFIGSRCFIGAHSIVLPGVKIGDECIVGTGSVVTKDVPNGSIVAGNPAKIIKSNIRTGPMGRLTETTEAAAV